MHLLRVLSHVVAGNWIVHQIEVLHWQALCLVLVGKIPQHTFDLPFASYIQAEMVVRLLGLQYTQDFLRVSRDP